jgi:IS5 family transposase
VFCGVLNAGKSTEQAFIFEEGKMRKAFSDQRRLDCRGVLGVELNLNCRDEIVPILRAIQHIYEQPKLRKQILELIAQDVNQDASPNLGRQGMDYWQILVLAAVRLGCNFRYDRLQDLAENHAALRHIMGVGDWRQDADFDWRRIRDNVCLLKPATIEKISHAIVAAGHRLEPKAAEQMRADFFVVETNIHWPSESSLIRDGIRKILELCVLIDTVLNVGGWRQADHLLKQIKKLARNIDRIASGKGSGYQERLKREYTRLLERSSHIMERAERLLLAAEAGKRPALTAQAVKELREFLDRTEQVRETARRRVLNGEKIPNQDKLFSIFEPHTQLYKRGKAGEPVQFGRMALVYEDAAGFITHSSVLGRDELERDVIIPQTKIVKKRMKGKLKGVSFDRGCHSPENQRLLAALVEEPCLPMPGAKQAVEQERAASILFRQARQRHPGVESAIGALQFGNGLERCRDRTELGLERYVALGILGRNLHVLGKLLIAREDSTSEAARSKRKPRAA